MMPGIDRGTKIQFVRALSEADSETGDITISWPADVDEEERLEDGTISNAATGEGRMKQRCSGRK